MNGKVAKILSRHEVVINRGFKHGVAVGQRYVIGGKSHRVDDPETGEYLGTFYEDGLDLKVTEVYERCAVLGTYGISGKTFTVSVGDECEQQLA